eukprot:scaffold1057_cov194-Skeletonema_menzelii.AAC.6
MQLARVTNQKIHNNQQQPSGRSSLMMQIVDAKEAIPTIGKIMVHEMNVEDQFTHLLRTGQGDFVGSLWR